MAQAIAAGAQLVEVEGTFSDCHRMAAALADTERSWSNLTSTYSSPFMTEAHKSIAYELVDAMGTAPGSIVIPLGAGPMLAGIVKGFEELRSAGQVRHVPVAVGVQAARCAPIVRAFEAGADDVTAWREPPDTAAAAIADPLVGYADHGPRTLELLRRHDGIAIAVDEDAIAAASRALGTREGVVCELAAAATLAAVRSLRKVPVPCVLMLSGHGLKDPDALIRTTTTHRCRVTAHTSPSELRSLLDTTPWPEPAGRTRGPSSSAD